MKNEAVGHTKMKRLCRNLGIQTWMAVGILEMIWKVTAREAPQGNIGKLSNEEIAIAIDYLQNEEDLMAALVKSGWVEPHPVYRLIIHDWADHCEDAVHSKLARAGLRFCDGSIPSFGRLSTREREVCEARYREQPLLDTCAQNPDPCAQNPDPCARHAHGVRLNGDLCAQPARARPSHALPSHAMPCPSLPEPPTPGSSITEPASESQQVAVAEGGERLRAKLPDPAPGNFDVVAICAERIFKNHPENKRDLAFEDFLAVVRRIVKGASETQQLELLSELQRHHDGWRESEEWRRDGGRYAKGLSIWISPRTRFWRAKPPEPEQPKNPYTITGGRGRKQA